jgi:peroxiredoxin
MKISTLLFALSTSLALACARPAAVSSPSSVAPVGDLVLIAKDGAPSSLRDISAKAPFTVLVFISPECPCLASHLDRLRSIEEAYAPRGVQVFAVDSEVGASPERAAKSAQALGLRFPVLVDEGAKLAKAVGAEYATYTVLVDGTAAVRFRGGIDSDKRKIHGDAVPYLTNALDDVLAGRPPRRSEAKTLGCSLRLW